MLQKLLFLCRFYANAGGRETKPLAAHFLPTTDPSPPVSAEKRASSKGGEVFWVFFSTRWRCPQGIVEPWPSHTEPHCCLTIRAVKKETLGIFTTRLRINQFVAHLGGRAGGGVVLKEGRTFLFVRLDLFLTGELSLLEDYANPSFLFLNGNYRQCNSYHYLHCVTLC